MARHLGSRPGDSSRVERYVRIAGDSGLLERRGAKAELARILHVTPEYIYIIAKRIGAKGSACGGRTE